ncbi:TolC family protein [Parabacteroides faecis]|uniref:Outer membrane protein TolC n=1 Tax=Parabacteroides faecis TaxID=1217282 RepID=A0ABR6KIP2_9BACT|nr:TolC family protein [Parabacteroides faecis]MBB4621352.1 outer membrane protein TolC [Parabacteroides faecis]GGJ84743.1 transporter [Parabacteroides faecis]
MKRICVILFLCLPLLPGIAKGQEKITLAQCYEWARANYPQIRQYGLIGQTEQYNLSNAVKGWLPQVTVNAKATYQSDVTKLPFDADKLSAVMPGLEIPALSKDQYQVVAELNQNIWDGGTIHTSRQLTKAQAAADREQLESDLYTLNDRVNQLYFGCLLQEELIRQNVLLQKELQINIDRITAMMANGVANQSDRESMEVELLNARQKEIELKASRVAFGRMLSAMIGKPYDKDRILEVPNVPGNPLPGEINRPELKALDAKSYLLELQNKQITSGLMPRIGAFVQGGYGRPGLNMLEDSFDPFYIAGVRLSWNMGKLYTLKNDRRKVATTLQQVEVQRETFLFNTSLELMQQNTEIQKISDLMKADDEIIRLRTSIKNAAEVKLENGVISVTDLIREINAEDMAKQTAAAHRIQHLNAVYNYMYTTNNE